MRKWIVLSASAGITALIILGVCVRSNFAAAEDDANGVHNGVPGLTLSVAPEEGIVAIGQPVVLKALLKNTSKTVFSAIEHPDATKGFRFTVTKDGKLVALTQAGKQHYGNDSSSLGRRTSWVKSGSTLTSYIKLSAIYDMTVEGVYLINSEQIWGDEYTPMLKVKAAPVKVKVENAPFVISDVSEAAADFSKQVLRSKEEKQKGREVKE